MVLGSNCIICEADRATTFEITDWKFYSLVATLSTQDNLKEFKFWNFKTIKIRIYSKI